MKSNESGMIAGFMDRGVSGRAVIGLLAVVAVVAAATFAGYHQMFSTFVDYDDEGYVMMSLHNVMQGRPLYDETYTQYGPAFFQLHAGIHRWLNLPVSHDVIRTKTLVQWIVICLFCLLTIFQLTRSMPLALCGFVTIFCLLERFCVEPGHPQDIAALGVATVMLLSTWLHRRPVDNWFSQNSLIVGLLAVVVATIGMTKANIGVLLLFGVAVSLLLSARPGRIVSFAAPRVLILGAALPVLLIAKYWSIQQAVLLPMIAAASIGLTTVMVRRRSLTGLISNKSLVVFVLSMALTVALILFVAWLDGTSIHGLIEGILLQHLGFAGSFFSPPTVTKWIIPATLISGLLAILMLRGRLWVLTALRMTALGLITALSVQFFFETATPSAAGYEGRMHVKTLMSFAPLLSWVILFPAAGFRSRLETSADKGPEFSRLLLCTVSAFQLLICYPIPGSQVAMGSFPLVIVLLVAVSDFLRTDLPHVLSLQDLSQKRVAVTGLLLFLSVITLVYRDISLFQRRQSFQLLDLPGASLIRLPDPDVRKYHQLTSYLKENADSFVFRESTQNCVYFWAEMDPPTAINATIWPYMLNQQQQQMTVDRIREIDRLVVVSRYSDSKLPEKDAPLAEYITRYFEPVETVGGFRIWMRKAESALPVVAVSR